MNWLHSDGQTLTLSPKKSQERSSVGIGVGLARLSLSISRSCVPIQHMSLVHVVCFPFAWCTHSIVDNWYYVLNLTIPRGVLWPSLAYTLMHIHFISWISFTTLHMLHVHVHAIFMFLYQLWSLQYKIKKDHEELLLNQNSSVYLNTQNKITSVQVGTTGWVIHNIDKRNYD